MEEKKSYYAIIPANVRYDKDLTPNAKLLYGEITALCNEKGYCWSENSYFANLYGVSNTSVSKWISILVQKRYIESQITYIEGTKQIDKRYLRIVNHPIEEKLNTPIEEKLKENNTSMNNTVNNTSKKENTKRKKSETSFIPPTYEEVLAYAKERKREDIAEQFYDYFNVGNWVDSKGNKVLNWKQKFLTWCSKNAQTPAPKPKEDYSKYKWAKKI